MILLGHGAGGRMTDRLIRDLFMPLIGSDELRKGDDSAVLDQLAISTDSFTVTPQDFPGGDIGRLAVTGTLNDLAMVGARPLCLAAAFILEEGLDEESLRRWVRSMGETAFEAGTRIVSCDTKVVEKGSADRAYITTTGFGRVGPGSVSASGARPGDVLLASGPVGDHGATILLCREGAGMDSRTLRSDCALLWPVVDALLLDGIEIHAMRDPTRGGLAQCLNELARASGVRFRIRELSIPVRPEVKAVCEVTGIDFLSLACEGRMALAVDRGHVDRAMAVLSRFERCRGAAVIGEVVAGRGDLVMETAMGSTRFVPMPSGELLPRIC
jgi:hydrogenase expression/formation protein HypE